MTGHFPEGTPSEESDERRIGIHPHRAAPERERNKGGENVRQGRMRLTDGADVRL